MKSSQIRQKRESMKSSRALFFIFCLASVFTFGISSIADGSRTEDAEQLNESLQENSGERNEQELPQNENSESWNIRKNEIISSEASDVGIFDFSNEYRAGYRDGLQARMDRSYNIEGNKIDSNKGQRVGIGNLATPTPCQTYHLLLVGLLF
ncbi:uncharacterized protein Pyn_12664 [Prunus yedoensis var. nudiflora]|uniref:Uncharacterized protein n=1 Tax=Prunus yedoensis var. nudiflora TaxID=2094558 RepID=A0A314Z4Y3_PRUYE|nr:uncharacterized protein Pyn_12664 [Prunus yedoensis var. nudiflora]